MDSLYCVVNTAQGGKVTGAVAVSKLKTKLPEFKDILILKNGKHIFKGLSEDEKRKLKEDGSNCIAVISEKLWQRIETFGNALQKAMKNFKGESFCLE